MAIRAGIMVQIMKFLYGETGSHYNVNLTFIALN